MLRQYAKPIAWCHNDFVYSKYFTMSVFILLTQIIVKLSSSASNCRVTLIVFYKGVESEAKLYIEMRVDVQWVIGCKHQSFVILADSYPL